MEEEFDYNDVFELDGLLYLVVDKTKYNNKNYYFTNKLKNEDEPSEEFIIFSDDNGDFSIEEDTESIKEVIKYFENHYNDLLETYQKETEEIDNN